MKDFNRRIIMGILNDNNIAYGNPNNPLPDIKVTPKVKTKPHFEFEIECDDELSKIKALESIVVILKKEYNLTVNVSDDFLKNVRFTIRKTIDGDETCYYTDLETAKAFCPPGYSVFDVITREEVYTVFKDEFKSDDAKYKKMWEDLHEYLNDRIKNIDCTDGYSYGVRDGFKYTRNVMKDFEGEMFGNE